METHIANIHDDGYYGKKRYERLLKARRDDLRETILKACPRLSEKRVRALIDAFWPKLGPIVMM